MRPIITNLKIEEDVFSIEILPQEQGETLYCTCWDIYLNQQKCGEIILNEDFQWELVEGEKACLPVISSIVSALNTNLFNKKVEFSLKQGFVSDHNYENDPMKASIEIPVIPNYSAA